MVSEALPRTECFLWSLDIENQEKVQKKVSLGETLGFSHLCCIIQAVPWTKKCTCLIRKVMGCSYCLWQTDGEKVETVTDFIFLDSKITADGDCSHKIKRHLLFGRKAMTDLDSELKKQSHHFANKGPYSQSCRFSSSHVQIWELDYKEDWALKSWCFWIVVLGKTLDSPLDSKEIKPVSLKEIYPEFSIGRTDAEAEAPILWTPDVRSWLTGKDSDAGKDWEHEEEGVTEDEMVGWHHQLNEHEFKQALWDTEGQGNLVCCRPWGHKESEAFNNWTTTVKHNFKPSARNSELNND